MRVAHGETGRAGDPARLPTSGWTEYGISERGYFHISARGDSPGGIQWLPERNPESMHFRDRDSHQAFDGPPEGTRSAEIWETWSDSHPKSEFDVHKEEPGRLAGPIQFILRLLELWHLEVRDAVGMLGFDPSDTDHVAAALAGREQLRGRDVRDRISHLFWIRRTLWSLFRDIQTENDWLRERHSMLDDRSPLSLVVDGSMEDLLLAREYVDTVAGR